MAMLAHRCKCGHPDFFHKGNVGECSYGWCQTKCRKAVTDPEPEIINTFIWTGNRSESDEMHLARPGERFAAEVNGLVPCDCDRCLEIHSSYGT